MEKKWPSSHAPTTFCPEQLNNCCLLRTFNLQTRRPSTTTRALWYLFLCLKKKPPPNISIGRIVCIDLLGILGWNRQKNTHIHWYRPKRKWGSIPPTGLRGTTPTYFHSLSRRHFCIQMYIYLFTVQCVCIFSLYRLMSCPPLDFSGIEISITHVKKEREPEGSLRVYLCYRSWTCSWFSDWQKKRGSAIEIESDGGQWAPLASFGRQLVLPAGSSRMAKDEGRGKRGGVCGRCYMDRK